jgi:glycosyltransferase involved in cell wall biosynthesis
MGSGHGWGVAGKYVAGELAALGEVRWIPDAMGLWGDALETHRLAPLELAPEDLSKFLSRDGRIRVDGPLIKGVHDKYMRPSFPALSGTRTFGYTVFEENLLDPAWVETARRSYDCVITGSKWCMQVLQENGLASTAFTVQGFDPELFHPRPGAREFLRDRFVVFSGGTFEYRKAQDIVIRAYKVLQDRHPDAFLVTLWHNLWDFSFDTMRHSRLIRFAPGRKSSTKSLRRVLSDNGIDLARVLTLAPCDYTALPRIYRNSDVGIFVSRAEGGPNLVLAEYMACGRPAIATATTGQGDIVTRANALVVETGKEKLVRDDDGTPVARWAEPELESAVEQLEWAYQHRDRIEAIGARAARDQTRHTWRDTARQLWKITR